MENVGTHVSPRIEEPPEIATAKLKTATSSWYSEQEKETREKIIAALVTGFPNESVTKPATEYLVSRIPRGVVIFGSKASKEESPFNQETFVRKIEPGDSLWTIIENILNTDPEFKDLDEAQRAFVVAQLAHEVISNPTDYGIQKDNSLNVGDTINLSKLFTDE